MTNIQMLIVQVMMAVDAAKQQDGTVPCSFMVVECISGIELHIVENGSSVGSYVCKLESAIDSVNRRLDKDVMVALWEIGNAQIREINDKAHQRLVGYKE